VKGETDFPLKKDGFSFECSMKEYGLVKVSCASKVYFDLLQLKGNS